MEYRDLSGNYRASSDGWIESKYTGEWKRLREHYQHKGYKLVTLYNFESQKRRTYAVHSLISQAFLGDRPDGLVVDHINSKRDDNRAENLRYITPRENLCRGKRSDLCGNGLPRGVRKNKNVFFAIKAFNGSTYFLGSFKDANSAGNAYKMAFTEDIANQMHSQFKNEKKSSDKGYFKRGNRYIVRCRPFGYIGSFGSEEEARKAYLEVKNGS